MELQAEVLDSGKDDPRHEFRSDGRVDEGGSWGWPSMDALGNSSAESVLSLGQMRQAQLSRTAEPRFPVP